FRSRSARTACSKRSRSSARSADAITSGMGVSATGSDDGNQPSDHCGSPDTSDSHGTSRQPSSVNSMSRSRRTGSRHSRAARQPALNTSRPPSAACASQTPNGMCHAMLAALLFAGLSLSSGLGDEPFQFFQFPGARLLGLQQAQDHLIERAVENLVQKPPRDLLAAVAGSIDESAPFSPVRDQALLVFHDAHQGLHGVEVQFAAGCKALVDIAYAGLAQFPENFEDLQLAFTRGCVCHRMPPSVGSGYLID